MDSRVQIAVARYREDVSWLARLAYPAIVYDKSGAPADHPLPNIGRETHTYLVHILDRYGALADYTVFLQGDPFPHMGQGAGPDTLGQAIARNVRLGVKFTGFAWYKLKCDRLGRPHSMAEPEKQGRWKGWGKDIPVGRVYEALFDAPAPQQFLVTAPAGMLFVARERILARPPEFYRKALALVETDPEDAENTGHAFERLWQIIFGGNTA